MPSTILLLGAPPYDEVVQYLEHEKRNDEPSEDVVKDSFSLPTTAGDRQQTMKTPLRPPHHPNAILPSFVGAPEWRLVLPEGHRFTTSLTRDAWMPRSVITSVRSRWRHSFGTDGDVSFLTVTTSDVDELDTDVDTQASDDGDNHSDDLEKSFALHENPVSSQITGLHASETTGDGTPASPSEHRSKRSKPNIKRTQMSSPKLPQKATNSRAAALQHVNTAILSQLPTPYQLRQMQPQTPTVNLIVGVIAKQPTRSITTRNGRDVDLLEVFVGDETRAGFAISFWLDLLPKTQARLRRQARQDEDATNTRLRSALDALKAGDVVLLRHVALTTFRNATYGQSLGRTWCRTSVMLLWRRGLAVTSDTVLDTTLAPVYDSEDLGSEDGEGPEEHRPRVGPHVERVKRVRAWVSNIVAPPPVTDLPHEPSERRHGQSTRDVWRQKSRAAAFDSELPPNESQG